MNWKKTPKGFSGNGLWESRMVVFVNASKRCVKVQGAAATNGNEIA
jgi:hypothetical protein